MKFLFRVLILGLILVIGYNYFLGSPAEKQQSQEIVSTLEELGKSISDLIKQEKEKYDQGKYDDAVGKIGKLIQSIKEKASDIDLKEKLDRITEKKDMLKQKIEDINDSGTSPDELEKNQLDNELKDLLEDLTKLSNSTEKF